MKSYLLPLLAQLCLTTIASAQLLKEGVVFFQRDFDGDGNYDWRADIAVLDFPRPGNLPVYEVRNQMRVSQLASVLKATSSRIGFLLGEQINKTSPIYLHPEFGERDLWLSAYRWEEPGEPEYISQILDEFPGNLSAIVGAKYKDPDTGDVLVGWFRFTRPNTKPGTAFTLESWAYNPIPDEPIRAGEPPDLPEPSFAWSEEGVTVSWPEKAAMLRLEMTTSLTRPVQWQPVETGGATTVTVPQGEGQEAFFRLVAPEL